MYKYELMISIRFKGMEIQGSESHNWAFLC